ncbi:sulfotransferase [Primorskyibacter sp. S87]|uniref:sulfotransferase n=1 Tax=Primorskyibacter sp. S87 TaxID=3415126 RepID=UPI003C79B663
MSIQSDFQITTDQLRQGRHNAALKTAKSAMKRHKQHPVFPNLAGIALASQNEHHKAVPFFQKALKLEPEFHDARKNLAQTLLFLKQYEKANRMLNKLVTRTPQDAQAWHMLGLARFECADPDGALEAVEKTLEMNPVFAQAHNLRGLILSQLGQIVEALECFREALRLAPNDAEILLNASLPLSQHMMHQEALEALERAVALDPANVSSRYWLATQHLALGNTEEARLGFQTTLEADPIHAAALERLVAMQSGEENAALEPQIKQALAAHSPKSSESAQLFFALGRVLNQNKRTEDAEDAWRSGKRIMARQIPYDPVQDTEHAKKIMARFDGTSPALEDMPSGPRPIYVLGLPRSGTTLTEAVLGANSKVKGLGERSATNKLLKPLIERDVPFDAEKMREFVASDQALLPELPPGTQAYVDKMPDNYRFVGFLLSAYPDARIISITRDPRDVALSMWKSNFGDGGHSYINDLKWMAHRFNLFAQLMRHWNSVFPGRMMTLAYEDLVSDIYSHSQSLAEYCDLEWEAPMTRPNENVEQVLTMSVTQLRQQVHTRSVGGWKQHAEMLAPLVDGLDPELWPNL